MISNGICVGSSLVGPFLRSRKSWPTLGHPAKRKISGLRNVLFDPRLDTVEVTIRVLPGPPHYSKTCTHVTDRPKEPSEIRPRRLVDVEGRPASNRRFYQRGKHASPVSKGPFARYATTRHEALRQCLLFLGSGRHPNVNVSVKGAMYPKEEHN